jgi:hypothetical protein
MACNFVINKIILNVMIQENFCRAIVVCLQRSNKVFAATNLTTFVAWKHL